MALLLGLTVPLMTLAACSDLPAPAATRSPMPTATVTPTPTPIPLIPPLPPMPPGFDGPTPAVEAMLRRPQLDQIVQLVVQWEG